MKKIHYPSTVNHWNDIQHVPYPCHSEGSPILGWLPLPPVKLVDSHLYCAVVTHIPTSGNILVSGNQRTHLLQARRGHTPSLLLFISFLQTRSPRLNTASRKRRWGWERETTRWETAGETGWEAAGETGRETPWGPTWEASWEAREVGREWHSIALSPFFVEMSSLHGHVVVVGRGIDPNGNPHQQTIVSVFAEPHVVNKWIVIFGSFIGSQEVSPV